MTGRGRRHAGVLALAMLACGCAAERKALGPPAVLATPTTAGLTVTLAWSASVDLDLYVTDPGLETVYFANPRSRSGGVLEHDARCADQGAGERSERVRWTNPPPGRYRVGVDFLETCGRAAHDAPYRLTIQGPGWTQETEGRARLAERDARVLEFTVGGEDVR